MGSQKSRPNPDVGNKNAENKNGEDGLISVASNRARPKKITRRIVVGLVLLYGLFFLSGGIRWPYSKRIPLSERVVLTEHHVFAIYPWFGMADNNKSFFLPLPTTGEYVNNKTVDVEGKTICSYGPYSDFHLSPSGQRVVVEPGLEAKPIEILDTTTGATLVVAAPLGVPADHDFIYPFRFVRWADDGRSFAVQVTGTYVDKARDLVAYQELWRIDAKNASASRERREEKPWQSGRKWNDAQQ
jgi:hypothetical protein